MRKGDDEVPKVFQMQNKFILIIFWAILAHTNDFLLRGARPREGREGVRESNPYFRAKPKLSVFQNEQFSGHFCLDQKFSKKYKML